MPLFFSILSYGIVYLISSDMVSLATNVIQLIMADSEPDFTINYTNTFNPGSVEISDENTVKRSDAKTAINGELYAYVKCEEINLDCPVYMDDTTEILKMGAGQIPATSQPGYGKLIMIGAHNNTFFNCLKNIEDGDIITMETSYGNYNYEVVYIEVVDVTGMDAYDFWTDHEQLLLYTCYPFDMLSSTNYRFMVHADLISGPTLVD